MWPDDRSRKAVLALKHPGALGRMFLRGTEVGLAEHAGRERLPDYFAAAHRALKPGGVFFNQAIGDDVIARPGKPESFGVPPHVHRNVSKVFDCHRPPPQKNQYL
jgi:hypothetical protein